MEFKFDKTKYGRELLIDCGRITYTEDFVTDRKPFLTDFHEIIILTKGKGVFKLDQEEVPFQPGTILLLPPNRYRFWEVIEEEIDGYFLIFEEEFIARFFNDALFLYRFHYFYDIDNPSYIQASDDFAQNLLDKFQEVRNELPNLQEDSDHLLRAQLYYILIQLNRAYKNAFDLRSTFFKDHLTLKFRRYLELHIRKEHNVAQYADYLQVSKSHLNKTLKIHFGKSSSELIKDRLVVEIKRELLYSEKSISEISHELSFSEPSNLNRFFRERTSFTPGEYRQLNLKKQI
ncbi:MAG: helix-turn-helix domain-containing protein [Bacteroidia bacterium]